MPSSPAAAPPRPAAPPPRVGRGGLTAPQADVADGYRRFLLGTAAAIYVGAAAELALVGHYASLSQVAPFVLIALGLGSVAWAHLATRVGGRGAGAGALGGPRGVGARGRGERGRGGPPRQGQPGVRARDPPCGRRRGGRARCSRPPARGRAVGGGLTGGASPLLAPGALSRLAGVRALAVCRGDVAAPGAPPRPRLPAAFERGAGEGRASAAPPGLRRGGRPGRRGGGRRTWAATASRDGPRPTPSGSRRG